MRILWITAVYPPARFAEADHSWQHCRRLAARGHDVHVLTAFRDGLVETEGVTLHPVMTAWRWRELPRLVRTLRQVKADAVLLLFLGTLYHYRLMVTITGSLVKWLLPGASFTVKFSDVGSARGKGRLGMILAGLVGRYRYGTLLTACDHVLLTSHRNATRLAEIDPKIGGKVTLMPSPPIMTVSVLDPATARAEGRKRLGVTDEELLIAYFGRIYPGKGLEMLMPAFRSVLDRKPEARMVMIGGALDPGAWMMRQDYPAELKALAARLGIAERLIWTGEFDSESDYASLCLYAADIAALPFDGGAKLSNSALSAVLIHGLPMVTTRTERFDEPLIDGANGLYGPVKDAEALAAGILRVTDDPALAQRLREGGYALVREWKDWDKAIEVTLATLRPKS